jgi:hypothetical protein
MLKKLAFCIVLGLAGCITTDDYYVLPENYQAARQVETRRFEAKNEEQILTAAAGVIQDLGYTIDESETDLGIITAIKDREAGSTAQKAMAIMIAASARKNTQPVYDVRQRVYLSLVSTKSKTNPGYNVRVKFGRVVWDNTGDSRVQSLESENMYSEFFDKLSQSLFLVANDL